MKPVTVGIVGGGQLARMLILAGAPLGLQFRILVKERECPAGQVCPDIHVGDWDNPEVLRQFGRDCDVVTLESEFVEAEALLEAESGGIRILPTPQSMATIQDKFLQKSCLESHGVPLPVFRAVNSPEEVIEAGSACGWPLVLKTRKLGYDGKGNTTIRDASDVARGWSALGAGRIPMLCEGFVSFRRELAMMITTFPDGSVKTYPVVETIQKDHICHEVLCPAQGDPAILELAARTACRAVEAVGAIGTFGVELFECHDGRVLVNELAPRVHNSGHYTIEACRTSQFENHIRAVAGLNPGSSELVYPAAVMMNILGEGSGDNWPPGLLDSLRNSSASIHWYGKTQSQVGRKMGHVTAVGASLDDCRNSATSTVRNIYRKPV